MLQNCDVNPQQGTEDQISSQYSFVTQDGVLCVVTYSAGPLGYQESHDCQDGYINGIAHG